MHLTLSSTCSPIVGEAERTARQVIGDLGTRWRHTIGVATRAAAIAAPLGVDRDLLVAAAWLHDIGYGTTAVGIGFHPLDGADYLAARGWPPDVTCLVAHHSGARFIAAARGLSERLAAYPEPGGPLADALTYADQTVGPGGDWVSARERYAEMLRRHGPESDNAKVDPERRLYLETLTGRVERRLMGACLTGIAAG